VVGFWHTATVGSSSQLTGTASCAHLLSLLEVRFCISQHMLSLLLILLLLLVLLVLMLL